MAVNGHAHDGNEPTLEADDDKEEKHQSTLQNLVFIFKASNDSHKGDRYEKILATNNIPVYIIPVLAFEFVNTDTLASCLTNPDQFGAIILTSPRAVQAVSNGLKGIDDSQNLFGSIQCFVVGPATYEAAAALGFHPEGEDSGNADALSNYILENIKNPTKQLLLPCSNIHREEMPHILKSKGLNVTEVISYATHPDEHIRDHVKMAVETKGIPEYAVFFSPSGFSSVHELNSTLSFSLAQTKIIALGPTTASAVTSKGYTLHGVAKKPDPESLLALLQKGPT